MCGHLQDVNALMLDLLINQGGAKPCAIVLVGDRYQVRGWVEGWKKNTLC